MKQFTDIGIIQILKCKPPAVKGAKGSMSRHRCMAVANVLIKDLGGYIVPTIWGLANSLYCKIYELSSRKTARCRLIIHRCPWHWVYCIGTCEFCYCTQYGIQSKPYCVL